MTTMTTDRPNERRTGFDDFVERTNAARRKRRRGSRGGRGMTAPKPRCGHRNRTERKTAPASDRESRCIHRTGLVGRYQRGGEGGGFETGFFFSERGGPNIGGRRPNDRRSLRNAPGRWRCPPPSGRISRPDDDDPFSPDKWPPRALSARWRPSTRPCMHGGRHRGFPPRTA